MDVFQQKLYSWFLNKKRNLPWRETNDPYKIWISEIILQQTRVAHGTAYYNRFIENFPTIFDLANAPENEVLKLWQGLGYYTRARNLHFTAKYIVNHFNGKFPGDYKIILSLKGIGQYSAAAISSIAFDLPYPAIDGNVSRVISRYFGITVPFDSADGKKEIRNIAQNLMPEKNTGFHNQAFMEFGALQCTPKSPDCSNCPLITSCFAFENKLTEKLPVKSKKTKQRNRYFYYFLIEDGNFIFLEKRNENDIWKNLYQLPLYETNAELSDVEILNIDFPPGGNNKKVLKSISATKKHILSHQIIYSRLIYFETSEIELLSEQFIRTNKKDIYKFAVPKLIEEFLKEHNFSEN
jgi:A/G-specific adenine glycosylase